MSNYIMMVVGWEMIEGLLVILHGWFLMYNSDDNNPGDTGDTNNKLLVDCCCGSATVDLVGYAPLKVPRKDTFFGPGKPASYHGNSTQPTVVFPLQKPRRSVKTE